MNPPIKHRRPTWKERIAVGAGGIALRAFLRGLKATLKFEVHDYAYFERAMASGRPVMWAAWHGDIMLALLSKLGFDVPPLVTMISQSRDGEMIARIAEPLGVVCVRGSSSKGGARGLLEMQRRLTEPDASGAPRAGIHFLDGPRGPRHRAKPGLILLARTTNALIVPVCFGASPRIVARSWDRHRAPLPFGRLICRFGNPMDVAGSTESDDAQNAETLERNLLALGADEPLLSRDYAIPSIHTTELV